MIKLYEMNSPVNTILPYQYIANAGGRIYAFDDWSNVRRLFDMEKWKLKNHTLIEEFSNWDEFKAWVIDNFPEDMI